MFIASLLIGLREGLEAALVLGILLAFLDKRGRRDLRPALWWGVGVAVVLSVAIAAFSVIGVYELSFKTQEIIGGSMSILAVILITTMVFAMITLGSTMKSDIESSAAKALVSRSAMFWLAFITVGREGLETVLLLWGWARQWQAFTGAIAGIAIALVLGMLLYRGMIRFSLQKYFFCTGLFLLFVAAGVLAYGIHDLQEAAVLPGPFSGAPITPTDFRTGEVLTGFFDGPYWAAAFPFGWAFDVQNVINPDGFVGALLKGTIGFTPQMSWLEVTAWFLFIILAVPAFLKRALAKNTRKVESHA